MWWRSSKRHVGKESRNSATFLAMTMEKWRKSSHSQLVDHLEAAANEDNEISDDLYRLRALNGHQGPQGNRSQLERMQVQCPC